jgi:hypothetical protein
MKVPLITLPLCFKQLAVVVANKRVRQESMADNGSFFIL